VLVSNMSVGTRSEAGIKAMFGRLADSYDRFNSWSTGGLVHRWRRTTAELAAPQPAGRVLDLTCGTGELSFCLVPRAKLVVGLDFSGAMLSRAVSKARQRGLVQRVHLVLGNARSLPFPTGSFDGITEGFGVRNLVDLPRCISEMVRVLRIGGRLAFVEIGRANTGWLRHMYRFYFNRLVPGVGLLASGGQASAFRYLRQSAADFLAPEETVLLLKQAGLAQVSYRGRYAGLIGFYHGTKMEGAS